MPPFLPLLLASWLGCVFSESLFQVRLKDGPSRCSGRVEVYADGSWGNVCDDGWDINDAKVVCHQLGCGPAKGAFSKDKFGQGQESNPILMKDVDCLGTEQSLEKCPHEKNVSPVCDHDEDAGVECEESPLRLVNGPNKCSGRLEVHFRGQWGTICDDGWGMKEAKVACRQLGCGRPLSANNCYVFGEGSGPIWLDEVSCTGEESTLAECKANPLGVHKCTHQEDIGIKCMEAFRVRLADGPDTCSGRLEVYYKGEWGTVCNDRWDLNNAEVVCRELECGHAQQLEKARPRFSQSLGRIWLDEVACSGEELSLEQCKHRFWGYHDCTHEEDVSVFCSGTVAP